MFEPNRFAILSATVLLVAGTVWAGDWLVTQVKEPVRIEKRGDEKEIVLTNGLISRTFRLQPNAATVGYRNQMTGESIIRGVKPEAMVEFDGRKYEVGGLRGQVEYAYLQADSLDSLTGNPDAFQFRNLDVGDTKERFAWKRKRYAAPLSWPPPGKSLTLHFGPPGDKLDGLVLSIHYEMYEGIPLLAKWLSIHNGGGEPVRLETFISEILAVVEDSQWKQ